MTTLFRQRLLQGERLAGTFLNLGSAMTAEIAGRSGLDWLLIDLEHGAGDHESLLGQLHAISGTTAVPIVRVAANDPVRFKRVLDLGAPGVMVPHVNNGVEAKRAVEAVRYYPHGTRGASRQTRASSFGANFEHYLTRSHEELVTIVQIETVAALESLEEIAAVDGVDVLFLGPLDLSINLGIAQSYDDPRFRAAVTRIASVARRFGKAAGMLVFSPDSVAQAVSDGYSLIAVGSDAGVISNGMKAIAAKIHEAGASA